MTEAAAKPRRGCFFYGCATGLVLLVLALGAIMIGLRYVKKMVNQYTDSAPMELPTVQMSRSEVDQLKQRFEAFQQAVREQRSVPPLELTSDDLNALIAGVSDQQALKGKFYLSVESNQLKGQVSLPLQDLGVSLFKGRYLNGTASFNVSFRNGALSVTPQAVIVKGKPLPESFMQELRKENLAARQTTNAGTAAVLRGLEDIQLKDTKVVVVPKEKP
jgi:hypothetical protein